METPIAYSSPGNAPTGNAPTIGANKICTGSNCNFSVSRSSPNDVKERHASMRKLVISVVLCIIFMTVEVVGGIRANSLAILTDAAHLLSDVAAFAISLFSLWASGWEATPQLSYGFFRMEILGALISIQLIWLLNGILVFEAITRLINDRGEVQGVLMFIVSTFGLVVNLIMAVLLGHDHGHGGHGHDRHDHDHSHSNHDISHHDHDNNHDHEFDVEQDDSYGSSICSHHNHSRSSINEEKFEHLMNYSEEAPMTHPSSEQMRRKPMNINVHSAYLHVLGDCIQSLGVMIGGAIIWWKPELKIIDLICTLIFTIVVAGTTIKMLRNILEVLMESTPREIDPTKLERELCELEGVMAIHELHVWAITVGKVILACHVTVAPDADAVLVLDTVTGYINREYNISHVTIQIERR